MHNGMYFEYDGSILEVKEFQHVKPGKGPAFVRAKVRNMRTGSVVERTFRAGEKIEKVKLETRVMEYLYHDGVDYVFMDSQTYDQKSISGDQLGDGVNFLKPNSQINVLFNGDEIMGVELAQFMEFEVTMTEPGAKGDTVQNALKRAEIETGAEIMVPMFIEIGNVIKVDTRTKRYIERVSK